MKETVLIIGAGIAGLSAALQAADTGIYVKLISSFPSERAQSVMAQGGINAALDTKGEGDSPEQHYEDTIRAGCGLADPNAVWNMAQAAPHLITWLHDIGVQFNTTGYSDNPDLRNFGGQKKKRTAFAQSDTGKQIMTALIDAVRQKESEGYVERLCHHSFQTLLLHDGSCCGCIIRDNYTGEVQKLSGGAVIIASGGLHGLFGDTTGSLNNTGEAAAELFRLGLPMANLEMIQYHPTTASIGSKRILISEAARAEGGRLFVHRGDKPWHFMEEKYPELGNLMSRDVTSREIWNLGRTDTVFLDMTGIAEDVINNKLSGLSDDIRTYLHKDIRKDPVPVYPGIHYFMGGIYVDEKHRTEIKHLYAAGECCAQYHGANRLGGNSLLGALYGGRIAARTACEEISEAFDYSEAEVKDIRSILTPNEKQSLSRILLNALSVVRNEETLRAGLDRIEEMSSAAALIGRAAILSALARKESRGAHWREDYPERDDTIYLKTTIAKYDGNTIRISFREIPKRR